MEVFRWTRVLHLGSHAILTVHDVTVRCIHAALRARGSNDL